MKPIILYRAGNECMDQEELAAASKHFSCVNSRMVLDPGQLVVGRYSVLPFYRELEQDLSLIGSSLVNAYEQHLYVADLKNWVADLGDLTPHTWARLEDLPETGPFVLKGATNSRKGQWKTHMYAPDKREAGKVYDRLCGDGLIGQQEIYVREYVPLRTYFCDVVGLPVTEEFRFFVYGGEVLCGGYYWSNHADVLAEEFGGVPEPNRVPKSFLDEVARRVGNKVAFYTLDVAETAQGEWIVVELNDGQMSGLSMNDPDVLYARLAARLQ